VGQIAEHEGVSRVATTPSTSRLELTVSGSPYGSIIQICTSQAFGKRSCLSIALDALIFMTRTTSPVRNVEIVLYTHSISGVTENDIIMAELIDGVPVAYSPKWLKEHPEAESTAKTSG
jgi:hypothetical protein